MKYIHSEVKLLERYGQSYMCVNLLSIHPDVFTQDISIIVLHSSYEGWKPIVMTWLVNSYASSSSSASLTSIKTNKLFPGIYLSVFSRNRIFPWSSENGKHQSHDSDFHLQLTHEITIQGDINRHVHVCVYACLQILHTQWALSVLINTIYSQGFGQPGTIIEDQVSYLESLPC